MAAWIVGSAAGSEHDLAPAAVPSAGQRPFFTLFIRFLILRWFSGLDIS
ncbi:MAG: hypothetical protein JWN06_680 [Propionibacteriaceae bacterium]|jgi:hypothetical protein|nr:hypothetical protein [Propionibacteriaceae bacterium]